MSTKTTTHSEILARPPDNGRSGSIRKRLAAAVLGLAAVSGIAIAIGADSTSTSPVRSPAPSQPPITLELQPTEMPGGCLNDIECYGEPSQLRPSDSAPDRRPVAEDAFAWCMQGVDCPPVAAPQTPAPDQDEPRATPAE